MNSVRTYVLLLILFSSCSKIQESVVGEKYQKSLSAYMHLCDSLREEPFQTKAMRDSVFSCWAIDNCTNYMRYRATWMEQNYQKVAATDSFGIRLGGQISREICRCFFADRTFGKEKRLPCTFFSRYVVRAEWSVRFPVFHARFPR